MSEDLEEKIKDLNDRFFSLRNMFRLISKFKNPFYRKQAMDNYEKAKTRLRAERDRLENEAEDNKPWDG